MTEDLWPLVLEKQRKISHSESNALFEQDRELHRFIDAARITGACPVQFSFFLNKLYKSRYVESFYQTLKENSAPMRWTPLSKLISSEEGANYLRVVGPRWNCFALIGSLGPIEVENNIELQVDSLRANSDAWSIVIYNENLKTVGFFSSAHHDNDKKILLPNGKYTFSVRFYSDGDALYCPGIVINGERLIAACSFPDERGNYQRRLLTIADNKQAIYFWQQYYIFYWLNHPEKYSQESIKAEFLPVGDPNNYFNFGPLAAGQVLNLSMPQVTLDEFRIYLVYFNEMSLPIFWTQIDRFHWAEKAIENNGAYLIRFVPRGCYLKPSQKPEYKSNVV